VALFVLRLLQPVLAVQRQPVPVSQRSVVTRPAQLGVAEELRRLGIQPGDRVAFIGRSFDAFWARLARVQISAEIPDATSFWASPAAVQERALRVFASAGVRAIIAEPVAGTPVMPGWQRVGNSGYLIYFVGSP
jgi:hypothetical protein